MGWPSLKKKTSENITSIYNEVYKEPRMPQTKPIVSIVNVVASASVDQKMDLNEITKNFQKQNIILNNFQD